MNFCLFSSGIFSFYFNFCFRQIHWRDWGSFNWLLNQLIMALKPVLKLKVDELFLRWISEPDTQHMLKENLKHLIRSEPLSATYPVGSSSRSAGKQASPRVRPSSPPLSSSKLPSPRSPRRPLTTKNNQRSHNGNAKVGGLRENSLSLCNQCLRVVG